MNRVLTLILLCVLLLSLTSCSDLEEDGLHDVFQVFLNNAEVSSQSDASNNSNVNYSSYTQLLNEQLSKYGDIIIEEYNITDTFYNCAGLCYVNLIDLDNNGVLELITITVEDVHDSIENGGSALDLYYDVNQEALSPINIYTLSAENEVIPLHNFKLSSHGNGGVRYGIEYSINDSLTYVIESFRSNFETISYYELKNAINFEQIAYVDLMYDYDNGSLEGTVNSESFNNAEQLNNYINATYGETIFHPISWLNEDELIQLIAINNDTYEFLGLESSQNSSEVSTDLALVDYSPYSALLKAYELDYNIENISATDYKITGMTLNPTFPDMPNENLLDASGFCYANLVDLDNNGILELVLIAYNEQEYDNYDDLDLDIHQLKYPNIIKVYTIVPEYGLEFLGSLPVSHISMPVSTNYGIEYIVAQDKTYISYKEIYQMGDGITLYYGLTEGLFSLEASFKIDTDGTHSINAKDYPPEEYDRIISNYGESKIHLIDNLNSDYLTELKEINNNTFNFLKDYPISNFSTYCGAYNNGQFYFFEHYSADFYPPEIAIRNYYKSLTLRDYEALSDLTLSNEEIERYQLGHNSDSHTYVPGYILSELEMISYDMIENVEMANDIGNYIADLTNMNTVIMYCRVNEVLDPHTTPLGLQVSGGSYDTYFILTTDDPDGLDWKISEIFDDKFYWD